MQQRSNKKCKCGAGGNGKCRVCSKIRMAIMLKNGYKNLGLATTWYSFYRKNNQHEETIISDMFKRFQQRPEYANAVNALLFFNNENKSKTPIKSLKLC